MTTDAGAAEPPSAPADVVVPVRHPWRWVSAAVVLVIAAQLVYSFFNTKQYEWSVFGHYFFDHTILVGAVHTIELTVLSMVIGVALGTLLAIGRLSPNPIVSGGCWLYIYVFRGSPVYVQILFWFALSQLYSTLSLGIPFGPTFITRQSNDVITVFTAALLGLALNEAAYMAEIVRAGILSVDEGQTEAASALGMTRAQTMRRIVLPQAMRVIIPPTGNETISMLKTSALASTIAYVELTQAAVNIYSRTYQQIPLLLVIIVWYLIMTSVLYVGQYYLERRFGRGSARMLPPTPLQRLRMIVL
ncbi:MAG TPA: amino acid ABC transporter permease, partial [Mycobacteriales bacterium]|nr:amino acid ABC transporter permease [Mycobacteriales bacterium]